MSRLTTPTILVLTALLMASQSASALDLKIYGVGHLSLDNVDDGKDSSLYVASSSSRLGFAGEQKLKSESPLTVIFQYETGLDPTAQGHNDGNGPTAEDGEIFTKGRPSFVGRRPGS